MFYIMSSIGKNEGLKGVSGSGSILPILALGTVVIGIFSAIFLFYTNSFLIKRRKKEFGLYNILGMEKKHIAKMLLWETLFTSVFSLIVGLIGGVIFSKLLFMLLLKLLNFSVPLGFTICYESIIITLILFVAIFLVALLFNLLQIRLAKPIELLHGGQHGEKEPKTKWIMTIIGLLALAAGYSIAIIVQTPLGAISLFFVAVILVMIGTYCLFTAGSIALLKALRKNKKYFYQTKHFTSISGMIYRMKQNAVGLANICILSTAVLVMLSSTVSLYIGMEDILRTRYPKDIVMETMDFSKGESLKYEALIMEEAKLLNMNMTEIISYRASQFGLKQENGVFTRGEKGQNEDDYIFVYVLPLDSYNTLENKSVNLENNEALIFNVKEKSAGDKIDILGNSFIVKESLTDITATSVSQMQFFDVCYVVLKEESQIELLSDNYNSNPDAFGLSHFLNFNTDADDNTQLEFMKRVRSKDILEGKAGYIEGLVSSRESFYEIYGSLFFLGIFLGILFLMATVLIIYYKQVSEGYDDRERFNIMQKVGMSKEEVKKSIRSQVLTVFFIPLITAVIHISFAFPMITRLLALFKLTNVGLFAICTIATILAFTIIYAIVYVLTARVYYRIVK